MNQTQLKTVGAAFASRHERNRACQERDEQRSSVQSVALVVTALSIVVAALILMF